MAEDMIGKTAIARYASGGIEAVGEIIGYCKAPTYMIKINDEIIHWRADLCHIVNEDCLICKGHGYVLQKVAGELRHDLAAIACPVCSKRGDK